MNRVACFGELLMRLSPELNQQWIRTASVPAYIGGAELNVATALSKWKINTKYCTALPDNYLTKEIIDSLHNKNIDASCIHLSGDRMGIYYLPAGADLKNAGVIYDRAYSSFAGLKPGVINWEAVFEDCNWFHFSAISPALNKNIAAVCKEALQVAKAKNMTISVDLNYREKLWQYGEKPSDVMPELVQYCDVVMGNIWAAESLLDLQSVIKDSKGKSTSELIVAAKHSVNQLLRDYPNITTIAYTFRLFNSYFGLIYQEAAMKISKEFSLNHTIDKVGSGDCFMAGLIYGLLNKNEPRDVIDFAAAAAIGKLQEKGDATNNSVEQIQTILNDHE